MWSWRYGERIARDALRREEAPRPEVGPGQVLLRMRAAAVNYRDLAIASGHYHVGVAAPLTPLSDGAGEVIEVGAGVTRVAVGDLACPVYMPDWIDGPISARAAARRLGGPTDGVLREYLSLSEGDVVRAPRHLTPETAATLPVTYVTAWHTLLEMGGLRPGARIVVEGAGGVSSAAVQIAAGMGAEVVAVTRRQESAGSLWALGASEVLVAATGDWAASVGKLTKGGADLAFVVSGAAAVGHAIEALRPGGRLLLVGYAAGVKAQIDIFEAIRRAVTIHAATAGPRSALEALGRFLELRGLVPLVGRTFDGDDPRPAFDALGAGGHAGKIVLRLA